MAKSVLEKYVSMGWLDDKKGAFSRQGRLLAAKLLLESYLKSQAFSAGVRDMSVPRVDGSLRLNVNFARLEAIREFNEAFENIPSGGREIVRKIVLENRDVEKEENKKRLKKLFCEALDCLVLYYIRKRKGS